MSEFNPKQVAREELLQKLLGPPVSVERAELLIEDLMHEAAEWQRAFLKAERQRGREPSPEWLIGLIDPYAQ